MHSVSISHNIDEGKDVLRILDILDKIILVVGIIGVLLLLPVIALVLYPISWCIMYSAINRLKAIKNTLEKEIKEIKQDEYHETYKLHKQLESMVSILDKKISEHDKPRLLIFNPILKMGMEVLGIFKDMELTTRKSLYGNEAAMTITQSIELRKDLESWAQDWDDENMDAYDLKYGKAI